MRSFAYTQLPGRVVFGVGALAELPREIERLGAKRALVLATPEQQAQAEDVARRLALEWGVVPLVIEECIDVEQLWGRSMEAACKAGLLEAGERVVITAGTNVNIPGSTNVIKVDIAS